MLRKSPLKPGKLLTFIVISICLAISATYELIDEAEFGFRQLEIAPTLAAIEWLQHDRRYRDSRGLFFIEGVRNFVEAVDHRFSVEALLYSEKLLIHPLARKFVRRLKRAGVPFARVTPEQFRRVSKTERASGVSAILYQRVQSLDRIRLTDRGCWTALSHVCSLGNFGTLLRTSAATASIDRSSLTGLLRRLLRAVGDCRYE